MQRSVSRTVGQCIALVLAMAALAAPAQAAPPAPVDLARGWEFARAPTGPWERVTVPHVMDGRPASEVFAGGTAWYRLRFRAPRAAPGGGWALRFDGVRRRAEVFLNGRRIGANDDPYTPFSLPAEGVRQGAENLLVVRVDNRRTPGWREGWWNWGGITRGVRLTPRGQVTLRGVGLLPEVDCEGSCRAAVVVDGWLESSARTPQRPLVSVRLRPPDGGPLTERTVRMRTVKPGETARVRFRVPVAGDPKLWAPERPQLYLADVQARLGERVEDVQSDRVGLRTVRVAGGRLELNGRRVVLRGASIQEDMPGRGPALTDADIDEIVRELKAIGANVTRAHYLLDERLLDRFDEEGILVWSQSPVYHRDVQLRSDEGRNAALDSVRRTVLEARRHPSVLTHSVANELSPNPDENPTTKAFLDAARGMTADLDPTVPASVDILGWPGFERQATYARFDLLGVNSYFGWYEGDEQHSTARLGHLEPFLQRLHGQYPEQALVMTEFGAESTMDGPAHVKETFAFQTEYLRRNLALLKRLDFMNGAIYWTLREFAVKPDWDGGAQREDVVRDGIHDKGLLEYETGKRKPAWNVAAQDFASHALYRSPASRAVQASLADPPEAAPASPQTTLLTIGLLVALALAGGLMALLARDVWRHGTPAGAGPAAAVPDELEERRRIRAAA
jgi:beta-glucuronidase